MVEYNTYHAVIGSWIPAVVGFGAGLPDYGLLGSLVLLGIVVTGVSERTAELNKDD